MLWLDDERLGRLARLKLDVAVESLLTGIVIISDWLASDSDLFPLLDVCDVDDGMDAATLRRRLERAWAKAHIPAPWSEQRPCVEPFGEFFCKRFGLPAGIEPRPIQRAAKQVAWDAKDPGLLVIEAPMGEGKTEAALVAAELLAYRRGLGGVCVALPTMATTDAMFARVRRWLDRLPRDGSLEEKDIYLAHGKAGLNEEFQGLVRESRRHRSLVGNAREGDAREFESEGATVSAWMYGRKKGMLSNFVVCTVDQVLMGALHMRHLSLRQLALANKVVVVDECHAYDLYMRQYLDVILQWLGYWRVPTVLLSATLPDGQRERMVETYLSGRRLAEKVSAPGGGEQHHVTKIPAYLRKKQSTAASAGAAALAKASVPHVGYPQITYTDGTKTLCVGAEASSRSVPVSLKLIDDSVDALVELLRDRLRDGGCAGVICDTVGRAQEAERALAEVFGEDVVTLDHSRFIDLDRMSTEEVLRSELGPAASVGNGRRPHTRIVVGTQVLEQSLDIDFDLLVTDVAPIDLLLQRQIPALIICNRMKADASCIELAEKYGVPLLRTDMETSEFMASVITSLHHHLAPRITRHGVMVEVYGEGVLLLGDSGIGKSEAAIELVKRGHRLVADDAVEIKKVAYNLLIGSAPEVIRYYIELRGIGVIDVRKLFGMGAVKDQEKIDMIINIEAWQDGYMYDRLGLMNKHTEILGVNVPTITVPVKPGRNLAVIIETAAMQNRQKKMGIDSALEFTQKINAQFDRDIKI